LNYDQTHRYKETELERHRRINIINNCLFVVEDIKLFINEIKNNGFPNINEGIQAERGLVNEMDSFLSSIEINYLDSLYNNYIYHTKEKEKERLPRSKFSVRNMRKISRSWGFSPYIISSYTDSLSSDTEQ
jgi:hypothetical protein